MNTQILGRALSRASDHGGRLVEHAHLPLALFPLQPSFLQDGNSPSLVLGDGVDDERRELLAAELPLFSDELFVSNFELLVAEALAPLQEFRASLPDKGFGLGC